MNLSQPIFWLSVFVGSLGMSNQLEQQGPTMSSAKNSSVQMQSSTAQAEEPTLQIMRCEPYPECTVWPETGNE